MAQYSKANYISLYNTTFADNTSGNISEGDMRQFVQDTADSVGAGIFTTKVTISSAEVLLLNSTPVTLVPAPGAGNVIEIISMFAFLDYGTIAYATNIELSWKLSTFQINANSDVLNATSDVYRVLPPATNSTTVNIVNQALTLGVNTGNPTAGNSPLYVYVTYRIITL